MQLLSPRGLWSCTFIAAHSAKLHAAHRHLHGATTLNLSQTRALRVWGGRSRELHVGLTVRGGVFPSGDCEARQMRIRPGGWARRRRPREQGGVGLNGLPKQLRFLSSLVRGGRTSAQGTSLPAVTRETCLEVSGLRCGSCVAKLENALRAVDGVVEASVNLATSQARVLTADHHTGHAISAKVVSRSQAITTAAEAAGYPAKILWEQAIGSPAMVVLDVQGLECGGCVSKGENALSAVEGVQEASINLATRTATVRLSATVAVAEAGGIPEALVAALSSKGYPSTVIRVVASDKGGGRQDVIEDASHRVTPAQRYEREAAESRGRVRSGLLLLVFSAATHLGHHAHHLFPASVPFGGALGDIFLSLPPEWFVWLQAGVATVAIAGPGSSLIRAGLAAMKRLSPDMDSLVATGVLAVYVSSVVALLQPSLGLAATFHEPVMLLGAVLLGRSLEARQRLKAAKGLQGLFDVRPDRARVVGDDGEVTEVSAATVNVGDTVEVLPSDRFPVDGFIVSGFTAADESSLTGEAVPIPKGPGDSVKAGTSSAGDGGAVRVRATATGAQSVLASVIALVEDAQARKAPVQRLVDKIAGKFTWLVFAASASTLVFWGALSPLIFGSSTLGASSPVLSEALGGGSGGAWALGARLAVDVCLVACPCSLGLATPTAVMVGTGVAAERGLLLTGGDVLEIARKVTTVVFDKTGTLTNGKPAVTGIITIDERWTTDQVLEAAAAVERGCRHPLADAIVSAAEKQLLEKAGLHAEGLRTVPGMGACAQVNLNSSGERHVEVRVGSPMYIEHTCPQGTAAEYIMQQLLGIGDVPATFGDSEEAIALSVQREVFNRLSAAETPVVVAVEGKPVGLIFATDTVRPAAASAIADLSKRGIKVLIASGDRREAVWAAAAAAGIPREDTSWGTTPVDKASLVRSLKARGEVVMVVGDGVNDAPALAVADVGVALRGGTGSAMDAADVVFMQDDVRGAGQAIDVSRLTMNKVRENLMWALGYNIIALPLAAGVFLPGWGLMLSPAVAGAIMSCSSVAVVTNSLLLRRKLDRELGPVSDKRRVTGA